MSFLRMDRGIVRGKRLASQRVVYGERKFTVNEYERCNAKFATRKRAAEFVYRSAFGGFVDGTKPTDFDQHTVSAPRAHDPRHVVKRETGRCRRVYRHGLLWRVTVENIWVSDHATMADALAGANAIGVEPGTVAKGIIVVPK